MSKQFVAILLAVVLGLFGIFWFSRDKAGAPADSGNSQLSNHVQGAGKLGVTLLEFGDFECEGCGYYYPIVKEVKEKYKDDITFQFRSFPLVNKHRNAMVAHRAAEAAALQDKFWEMHDLLYERQQIWPATGNVVGTLEGYASELGLNIEKFKQDFNSSVVNSTINADIKAGQEIRVDSTPTFVLNGKKLEDAPRDAEGFYKLIDDLIAANKPGNSP